ncbi:ABC transporter permease [Williamsoniiplasma lucivorax]|uniref:Ribose transport system permease protein n=1 Tax=Williamsoniiplasma lucivorax TaxID=209274 RepID=A0A2S5R9V0_9MOLU|nr:ABC transporter permease [Williamsoniiplasma lucivorax]PPE04104.1 ribose transport system permease protein [Williamsoniiplasma lucivorax]
MKQILKKNNKKIILGQIESRVNSEKFVIKKFYQNKIEKKQDYIFLLATYRDNCLADLRNKIVDLEKEKEKALTDLEYKFKNLEIFENEFKIKKALIENGEFANFNEKISKINKKIEAKEIKWNKLISKKTLQNKTKISKFNTKQELELHKIDKKSQKINLDLENSIQKLQEMDEEDLKYRENRIQNSKIVIKKKELDQLAQNKAIGPLRFEELREEYNNKIDDLIDKSNSINETKYSKRYSSIIQKDFLFAFSNKSKIVKKGLDTVNAIKLIFIIMIFAIAVGIVEPGFFSTNNWKNIFYLNADIGCMAIGVTIIILTGGIDLSIGSTMAFATAMTAKLILGGLDIGIVLLAVVAFCAASGLISGIFVSILRFPPFIITLILMMIWRGSTQFLLGNVSQAFDSSFLTQLIQTEFLGLSAVVWIMFALAIVTFIILKFTVYGRHVYAIGGNYRSAQLSGIKTKTVLASVYVLAGFCVGIGSIIYNARIQTAAPSAGNAWELDAIACVVLGGTLLTGGKGGIVLTMLGWFTMSVLKNALNLVGLSSDIQLILKGLIIMVAVLTNTEYKIVKKIKLWFIKQYNQLKLFL